MSHIGPLGFNEGEYSACTCTLCYIVHVLVPCFALLNSIWKVVLIRKVCVESYYNVATLHIATEAQGYGTGLLKPPEGVKRGMGSSVIMSK